MSAPTGPMNPPPHPAEHKTTTSRTHRTKLNRRGSLVRLPDSIALCSCGWLAYADNRVLARWDAREHRELMARINWTQQRKLGADEAHNEVWLGWARPPHAPYFTAHCLCGAVAGCGDELQTRHALHQHIQTANLAAGAWWCDGFKQWMPKGEQSRACQSHDHAQNSPNPYWHTKVLP